jgi:hypothetical protein
MRIGFHFAVPGIALIFVVTFGLFWFAASPASAQHTYYISKSLGSDSNTATQAQSKSAPWQHLPGMAGCTGTGCANIGSWGFPGPGSGYTPVAGDQFILYGGDTWVNSDFTWVWVGSGSGVCVTTPNASCMYIGVDKTWYNSSVCGASWCRPIFNAQGSVVTRGGQGDLMVYIYGSYVTLDNIEFTGFATSGGTGGGPVYMGLSNGFDVVENSYFHGWSHAATGDQDTSNIVGCSGVGNYVHDSVFDGSDEPGGPDMLTAIHGCSFVYNNYITNVTSGITGTGDIIHDNWIGPVLLGYTGGHRNAIQNTGFDNQVSALLVYNNVVTQVQNGGMGQYWLEQGGCATPGCAPAYVFNNLEFNTAAGNNFDLCQLNSYCGPFYIFNNTLNCGSQSNCFGQGGNPSSVGTVNLINNHCILGTTGTVTCPATSSGALTFIETNDLAQSTAQAGANVATHFDQYTGTQTHVYSPVASENSTVSAGTNEQSLCTTISGLNAAAGTACQHDTSYTCSYNTSNRTLSCPDVGENTRPASAAWDIGAYLLNAGDPRPNPPTGLTAAVK